jgi:biotin operon repressor
MSRREAEVNLEARAEFFKALAHPARLLIVSLIDQKPRHGEELAAILGLNPATVSHHLARLTAVGLLVARKDQYYQVHSLRREWLESRIGEFVRMPQPGLAAHVAEDAYREKVLRTFFHRGRLVRIPAQRKKRQIVLERLVEEFLPERDYAEREVNQTLVEFHDDVATLRRELIGYRLMKRAGGIYRRIVAAG